jgi:hypothetical protein
MVGVVRFDLSDGETKMNLLALDRKNRRTHVLAPFMLHKLLNIFTDFQFRNHHVNLVYIADTIYLVDVGFANPGE